MASKKEDKSPIDFTRLESCPKCETNWMGDPIPKKDQWLFGDARFFSRVIGISSLKQDRTIAWQCPDCSACWDRDSGGIRKSFNLSKETPAAS